MLRVAAYFLTFLAVLSATTHAEQKFSAEQSRETHPTKATELYGRLAPGVMTVLVRKADGSQAVATAFMGPKDGMATTAWHVLQDARAVTVRFSDGEEFEASGLVDKDEKRDVAIFRVRVSAKPPLTGQLMLPPVGADAYVIGAPQGLEFSITSGIISQVRAIDGSQEIQFSCPASPGSSGGPLVASDGAVVGVVSWQIRDGQNINFAIPYRYVAGLDVTLPTTPWENVTRTSGARARDTRAIDEQILLAAAHIEDSASMCAAVFRRYSARNAYRNPLPPEFFALLDNMRVSKSAIESLKSDEPKRAAALAALTYLLDKHIDSIQLLHDAFATAYRDNGWTKEANELVSRSMAASTVRPPTESWWDDLKNDADFMANARKIPWADYFIGPKQPITLGIKVWVRNTLQVVYVEKGMWGEKMGLADGDLIRSLDGTNVATMREFKDLLLSKKGSRVVIGVQRNGAATPITWAVPVELGGK